VDANHEGVIVRDRAGWWLDVDGSRFYLFTAEGMREALKGFDFARGLDVLQEAGALPQPGANGERSRMRRIGGRPVKVYAVDAARLEGQS
jgi:putative DNA primase/helicase